jgi:trans-aconitate methyltransferase
VTDPLLQDQIAYYRRRAAEYDATAHGDRDAARERIARITDACPAATWTLELACGTGMWTQSLAARDTELTAVDASPEMLAIARERCPSSVEFVQADILDWVPDRRFDLIFFAFWLSHVPSARLADFFVTLDQALTPGGRIVFVDEHVGEAGKESLDAREPEVARRTLSDGSSHRLVKVFIDPAKFADRLGELGWGCHIENDGPDWVIGTVQRATAS